MTLTRSPLKRTGSLKRHRPIIGGVCVDCGGKKSGQAPRCRECWKKSLPKSRHRPGRISPEPVHGVTVTCVACGNDFQAFPSQASQGRKYCSRACFFAKRPERSPEATARMKLLLSDREGKKNPNYRNGKRMGMGRTRRAFNLGLKGESCCRVCGDTNCLSLHHAIPRALGAKETHTNLLNGLPLCGSCHARWHRHSLAIYRNVFTEAEWAYLVSAEMPGRVTSAWLDKYYPEPVAA